MNADHLVVTLIDVKTDNQIGESYQLIEAWQEG